MIKEIKYGTIPALQKELDAALAAEKERNEGGRDSLLRQSVTIGREHCNHSAVP